MEAQYTAINEEGASDYALPEKPEPMDYVLHPLRFF